METQTTTMKLLTELSRQADIAITSHKTILHSNDIQWTVSATLSTGDSFLAEDFSLADAVEKCYTLVHQFLIKEINF